MLIYNATYYRKNGTKTADSDSGITWAAVVRTAKQLGYYVEARCTNGEPKVAKLAPSGEEVQAFPWETK